MLHHMFHNFLILDDTMLHFHYLLVKHFAEAILCLTNPEDCLVCSIASLAFPAQKETFHLK